MTESTNHTDAAVAPANAGGRTAPAGLQIHDLSVVYRTEGGELPAVRAVELAIASKETLGLVGESGSGKTTLALGAIGYLPGNGRVTSGSVRLGETDLLSLSSRGLRQAWGSRIGYVSQSPQTALNPSLTIGQQLDEMGRRHLALGRREVRSSSLTMLERVDMPDPVSVAGRYPHQLSGGMLQRAAIAMALLTSPELLILDEPTTALDVTTQALVLDLVEELKEQFSTAILYITHNLGVVARICDRVAVMYAGEVAEEGAVIDIFERPLHPYTVNLLNCVPKFEGCITTLRGQPGAKASSGFDAGPVGDAGADHGSSPTGECTGTEYVSRLVSTRLLGARLATIPGSLPQLDDLPAGCVFAPRCPLADELCRRERPHLETVSENRRTSCWRWESLLSETGRRRAVSMPAPARATDTPKPATDTSTVTAGQAGMRPAPSGGEEGRARLLEISNITKVYRTRGKRASSPAVDGVTSFIDQAQTLGLVGESGSGKTTLARVVGGLTPPSTGRVLMDGDPLGPETDDRSREVLRRLQMVFQNPDASLNPRRTVGQAIIRPLLTLGRLDRRTAARKAYDLLDAVRLPAVYFHRYPSELSGGEKQRVAIARAFAAAPDLVICDEPISSLDVSVQGSLMNLLVDLQAEQGTSYLFISHDVAAVQHLSHRIAVMYLGALMEQGDAARVLAPPYHPYTEALLSAIPVPDPRAERAEVRLRMGAPAGGELPSGCRFHPRCPRSLGAICETVTPPWHSAGQALDHSVCCHIPPDELLALQTASIVSQPDRESEPPRTTAGKETASSPQDDPEGAAR